jgi:hypothetical protein
MDRTDQTVTFLRMAAIELRRIADGLPNYCSSYFTWPTSWRPRQTIWLPIHRVDGNPRGLGCGSAHAGQL